MLAVVLLLGGAYVVATLLVACVSPADEDVE